MQDAISSQNDKNPIILLTFLTAFITNLFLYAFELTNFDLSIDEEYAC